MASSTATSETGHPRDDSGRGFRRRICPIVSATAIPHPGNQVPITQLGEVSFCRARATSVNAACGDPIRKSFRILARVRDSCVTSTDTSRSEPGRERSPAAAKLVTPLWSWFTSPSKLEYRRFWRDHRRELSSLHSEDEDAVNRGRSNSAVPEAGAFAEPMKGCEITIPTNQCEYL